MSVLHEYHFFNIFFLSEIVLRILLMYTNMHAKKTISGETPSRWSSFLKLTIFLVN